MSSELHQNCLICQSNQLQPLKKFEHAHLVKCKSCSFVFSQQIPTTEELINHYEGYGRNDYLSPITIKRYHEILDRLEQYRSTNNLLDVGCGIGYFLEVAKERGWNVYGTEFTDKAVEICKSKGITIHQGVLDPANYEPDFFDVLVSFEVIEHINNPVEEVANFAKVLRKGGAFYCTTPNFKSISKTILGNKWSVIIYPEHLSYYTPKTLKRLLKNNGLSTVKKSTTGISMTRMKQTKQVEGEAIVAEDSDDEKLRSKMETNWFLKFVKATINGILSLFGKGDTIKIYAVKK
jgi:2-polyprenyl-3-methyl-5-hydroxy-6-metoxy-1,4-benzoquinol methylase